MKRYFPALLTILFAARALAADSGGELVDSSERIQEVFSHYCIDCHDDVTQKGDIRLDNFFALQADQKFDLLSKVEEQVFTGSMPPKKADQLAGPERKDFVAAIDRWHELQNKKSAFKLMA